MKKILFITAFIPSRISAGENYSRQIINKLAEQYKIDLICFNSNNINNYLIENDNVNLIKVFNQNIFRKLFNWFQKPFIFPVFNIRYNFIRGKVVDNIISKNQYDYVFLDYSQCFYFGKSIKLNKVLISHDILTQRYSRQYNFLTKWVKHSEGIALGQVNATVFTFSEKDRVLLKDNFNVDSFVTSFFLEENIIKSKPATVEDYFVFFARWGRNDNINGLKWFVTNVLPKISSNIKFKIIGIELENSYIDILKKYKNVEILGFVENPYPIISNAKAVIAPLFSGAGVKVKVIDSLACGTPVLGTNISFEGISPIFNDFLFRCDDSSQFITKIENFNISKEDKLNFKDFFLKNYQMNSIIDFINNKLK